MKNFWSSDWLDHFDHYLGLDDDVFFQIFHPVSLDYNLGLYI